MPPGESLRTNDCKWEQAREYMKYVDSGWLFFFFQAEDGIRDIGVTGVQTCALPIFASGGAGRAGHFPAAIEAGADAVLAASVFHNGDMTIGDVKRELSAAGMAVR